MAGTGVDFIRRREDRQELRFASSWGVSGRAESGWIPRVDDSDTFSGMCGYLHSPRKIVRMPKFFASLMIYRSLVIMGNTYLLAVATWKESK